MNDLMNVHLSIMFIIRDILLVLGKQKQNAAFKFIQYQ